MVKKDINFQFLFFVLIIVIVIVIISGISFFSVKNLTQENEKMGEELGSLRSQVEETSRLLEESEKRHKYAEQYAYSIQETSAEREAKIDSAKSLAKSQVESYAIKYENEKREVQNLREENEELQDKIDKILERMYELEDQVEELGINSSSS